MAECSSRWATSAESPEIESLTSSTLGASWPLAILVVVAPINGVLVESLEVLGLGSAVGLHEVGREVGCKLLLLRCFSGDLELWDEGGCRKETMVALEGTLRNRRARIGEKLRL